MGDKYKIGAINTDMQPSLNRFINKTERKIDLIPLLKEGDYGTENIGNTIRKARQEYDILFVDTPGKFEGDSIPAIINSTHVMIPFQPTENDIAPTIALFSLLLPNIREKYHANFKTAIFPARVKVRSSHLKYLKLIPQFQNLPPDTVMFKSHISDKMIYQNPVPNIQRILESNDFIEYSKDFNDFVNI
jgi:cellulose biosynthesis protein BcsQ